MAPVASPASVVSALVWVSLHPLQLITSAGLVRVRFVTSSALRPVIAPRAIPISPTIAPPTSPRAYFIPDEKMSFPASASRLGSLILPSVVYCVKGGGTN